MDVTGPSNPVCSLVASIGRWKTFLWIGAVSEEEEDDDDDEDAE